MTAYYVTAVVVVEARSAQAAVRAVDDLAPLDHAGEPIIEVVSLDEDGAATIHLDYVIPSPPLAGTEPPGMLTIRRVIESSEALALDSEDDRESLIRRLAIALGIA